VSEVLLEEDSKQMEGTEPQTVNRIFYRLMCYVRELTDQPCCNTDLAPSNFHIFGALKERQVSKRFATDANLKQDVAFCLQTQDTIFSRTGIRVLVPRLNKYLIPLVKAGSSDAYHLLCVHQGRNKFLSTSSSAPLFF
jgi:hypothetical protein